MYDYNTAREPIKLREFGRNIQNLASYVTTLKDKEERGKYAEALVELMKQVVPSAKDNIEGNHRIWDDLHILSDFNLDIEGPYPQPEKETLDRKPDKVTFSNNVIRFRHYGKNVDVMVAEAIKIEDAEKKEAAVFHIARLIKSFHITWNKEMPNNEVIAKNIKILSNDELVLDLEKAEELDLLEPLYREKPKPANNKNSGKGGKSQNRRRRFK